MSALAQMPTEPVAVPLARETKRFYKPELDLLRLFAFLLVFARHVVTGFGIASHLAVAASTAPQTTATAHGWGVVQRLAQSLDFGVCLFFFLSSYLITALLLLEHDQRGKFGIKGFYLRRGARIWPLYFVFLGIMALAGRQFPWMNLTFSRLLLSAAFLGNWAVARAGWAGSPIDPLWSVSVEEQFYLLWPQILRGGRQSLLIASSIGIGASFFAIAVLGSLPACHNTTLWANSLVQGLFFCGGSLVAQWSLYRRIEASPLTRIGRFISGLACWVTASTWCAVVATDSPAAWRLIVGYALMLAGSACIFLAVLDCNVSRVPRWSLYLGKLTYGLYVFHFLCLEIATRAASSLLREPRGRLALVATHLTVALLALALTIVCATASYEFMEKPFLQLKRRFTVIPSRPV
jgi:peptidoglycan/LPS O-acetylase OafA/YrhL